MSDQPVQIIIQSDPWQAFKVFAIVVAAYFFGRWRNKKDHEAEKEEFHD